MITQARAMISNRKIFEIAYKSVLPREIVAKNIEMKSDGSISIANGKARIPADSPISLVAFGKASVGMAAGAMEVLGSRVAGGLVSAPVTSLPPPALGRVRVVEGAKGNLPDAAAASAAAQAEGLAAALGPADTLLVLISGGGSALLPAPVPGLSLGAKREAMRRLAGAGASIRQLNTLRTHLSRLKGGRLARVAAPAQVVSLIFSDVIGAVEGSALGFVASGPTVRPTTTPQDALRVLQEYGLENELPDAVRSLESSIPLRWSEEDDARVRNVCVGSNEVGLEAARAYLESVGVTSRVLRADVEGEAGEVGRTLGDLLLSLTRDSPYSSSLLRHPLPSPLPSPLCLLWGGETTVRGGGEMGVGGRNQELALAALVRIGEEGPGPGWEWEVSALGSDGQDGPNDAAGASFTHRHLPALGERGVLESARAHLLRHDSYNFWATFAGGDCHVKTGLTGTNVMDFLILSLRKL